MSTVIFGQICAYRFACGCEADLSCAGRIRISTSREEPSEVKSRLHPCTPQTVQSLETSLPSFGRELNANFNDRRGAVTLHSRVSRGGFG